jgi:hypothetical protein
MKRKDLFLLTTDVEASKTIGEIQQYLIRMGANQISTQYDDKTREPIALYFTLTVRGSMVPFTLPARVEPVFKIIHGPGYGRDKVRDMSQAKRVAWRQIYRWIQAQLALIETGMVTADEVLSPYIQVGPNETLYQRVLATGVQKLLQLPAASE